jgi:hypothetical protein
MRNADVLPIAATTSTGICARCGDSMLATADYFDYICPQKLLTDVGYLCFNGLTWNGMPNKNNLAVVSSNAETAISYFVDLQVNYVANFYYISFSHC